MTQPNDVRRDRIRRLIIKLCTHLYEKEEAVKLVLLAALAGESVFLLGPPGTAKSMIARRLKFAFREAKTFEYLMGKFSTPDEVFGPVSISRLKNEDKYERLTDNYLPGANIVFLDEIWKASPPIQNSLLTVLNEKIYRNGEQEIKVDLRALISASNELPLKGEGLDALWDRFLIRLLVSNIKDESSFDQMLLLPGDVSSEIEVAESMKIADWEYRDWQEKIAHMIVPQHIVGLVSNLRKSIHQRNSTLDSEEKLYVSDRRWRKIIQLLRASAFLNGRDEVHVMDCFLISYCIWDQVEQMEEVNDLVLGSIANFGYRRIVSTAPIQSELNTLRNEIDHETKDIRKEKIRKLKSYKDEGGNVFYSIDTFWGDSNAYIRKSDWERLRQDEPVYIPIFETSGNGYKPFQNYGLTISGAYEIMNKGQIFNMETKEVEQEILLKKAPEEALIRIWNSQVQLLLDMCEQGIERIEGRKILDEPYWQNHLFIDRSHIPHLESSLRATMNDILNLKLEVQKTRHMYESIEES